MPIYAYKCESCGHRQDVLQKMSDPVLTVCPACGASAFAKQLTAAGFQLKGSGWYATDFRDSGKGPKKDAPAEAAATETPVKDAAKTDTPKAADPKPPAAKSGDGKVSAPTPAAAPPPPSGS